MRLPDPNDPGGAELRRRSTEEAFRVILEAPESICTGIFGITNMGKSNFAKALVAHAWSDGWDVIVSDMKDEHSVRGRPRDAVKLGTLAHRWTIQDLRLEPGVLRNEALQLAVVPMGPKAEDWGRAFNLVARLLRHLKKRKLLWVIEETQYFERYEREWVEAVATQWRDFNVRAVFISQRAGGIEINACSQMGCLVSFAQNIKADVDALRARTAQTDTTYADRVARLTAGQFELWLQGENKNEQERRRQQERSGQLEQHADRDGGGGGGSGPLRGREASPGRNGVEHQQGQLVVQGSGHVRLDEAEAPGVAPAPPRNTAELEPPAEKFKLKNRRRVNPKKKPPPRRPSKET